MLCSADRPPSSLPPCLRPSVGIGFFVAARLRHAGLEGSCSAPTWQLRKRTRGGNYYGYGTCGVGKEREVWTDKITDQRKMGGQRFWKNFPDRKSIAWRSDPARAGGPAPRGRVD